MQDPKTDAFLKERIASFIKINDLGCWEWHQGKASFFRRVIYTLFRGPYPRGLVLLHSCDNPKCMNPEHLSPGTQRENMEDMKRKNRAHRPPVKLSQEAVMEIRHIYLTRKNPSPKRPWGATELSKKYNVSVGHVARVAKGK